MGRVLKAAIAVIAATFVVFFFFAPVVPMPNTSTSNGSISWVTYGSASYVYSCVGATVNVQTTPSRSWLGQFSGYSLRGACPYVPLTT